MLRMLKAVTWLTIQTLILSWLKVLEFFFYLEIDEIFIEKALDTITINVRILYFYRTHTPLSTPLI